MRTIIAGSRKATNEMLLVEALLLCNWEVTTVLCGCAKGADELGKQWAIEHDIPIEFYPPNWIKFGIKAGHIRNAQMAENAEALIALWDGQSKGTANMITNARRKKLKYFVLAI